MSNNLLKVTVRRSDNYIVKLGELFAFCGGNEGLGIGVDDVVSVDSIDPLVLSFSHLEVEEGWLRGRITPENHLSLDEIQWYGLGSGVEFEELVSFLAKWKGHLDIRAVFSSGDVERIVFNDGVVARGTV